MRTDAIALEEERLDNVLNIVDYNSLHERHRIFPGVFRGKDHKRILDIAAGVGVVGKKIQNESDAEVICNDICPKCLSVMNRAGLKTVSFNVDVDGQTYPFADGHFDAVVALATIEHLINFDHFLDEINRILSENGRLYISAPNYSGLPYLLPFLLTGKTFHDPVSEKDKYEFYAHVRYFTYRSLTDVVQKHGFVGDEVYLPLPESSTRYTALKENSKLKAHVARNMMRALYRLGSPRWAADPVICFRKGNIKKGGKINKIIL